ncbi:MULTISPECIES: S-methyl-5'-thioadenosine phosphorylase [unclassified Psychrobacter]|uniref:S-methyl-5'-thioadenosine phosphorylase n=1 Tax=unclassified Psychrobacter TaxID=196806 RepID=UPI000946A9D2|nr:MULTISPECIES: S-methyl-5'-thioadenosine phosphorylase [unclassified Psychrobacter]OLF39663.1 methylthioadenosine phosphorylase [Psychrobacter sp. Cmf 22.2]
MSTVRDRQIANEKPLNNSTSTTIQDSADIAIIGGSGLYQMQALTNKRSVKVETPYGDPSDDIVLGELDGVTVAFLTRHGKGHRLIPSEVPYRANIYALKTLGVRYIISVSAVGSLQETLKPLDMVIPDQMIDMTKQRVGTFFGDGAVAHVSMADPLCSEVADILIQAYEKANIADGQCHSKVTYVCIEGPQFSTRAESHWYRQMQADIIGMTNMPEAKLAREASIAYATLALVTDFDSWHPTEEAVSADYAIQNLMKNADNAQQVIEQAVALLANEQPESIAHIALEQALVTPVDAMSDKTKTKLGALLP